MNSNRTSHRSTVASRRRPSVLLPAARSVCTRAAAPAGARDPPRFSDATAYAGTSMHNVIPAAERQCHNVRQAQGQYLSLASSMPLVPEAYQRHHKGCPKADCAAAVSLKVCRGTSVPENRGKWYEVCHGTPTHFVCWREDLPNVDLSGPIHPALLPLIASPPTTPSRSQNRAVAHPTVPLLPALLLPPAPAVPRQSASSISDGDGSCNGKDCQAKGKHVRSCRTCSFKLCQICCRIAQRENNRGCAEKHHMSGRNTQVPAPTFDHPTPSISISDNLIDPQLRDSTPSASYIPHESEPARVAPVVPSTGATAVRDAFYDSSKPLRPEHYHARQTAREELEAHTRRVAQRKAHEEEAKHNVRLLFWNEDKKDPKIYQVPVPKEIWPTFSLKLCSPAVCSALGITDTTLIETFEPAQWSWCVHDVEVSRNLELETNTLLYHTQGIQHSDMSREQDSVLQALGQKRPRKRPASVSFTPPPRPTTRAQMSSPPSSSLPPSPPSPSLLQRSSSMTSQSSLDQSTSQSSPVESLTPEMITGLRAEAASGMASWPLKYVCSMADGFSQMLLLCGSQQQKFSKVFPGHIFKPTTFKQNYRIWKQAPDSLKDRYVEAGLTDDGLWSRFHKEAAQLDVQSQGDTASPGENSDIPVENTATAAARSIDNPVVVSVKLEPMEAEIPASASGLHVVVEDGKEYRNEIVYYFTLQIQCVIGVEAYGHPTMHMHAHVHSRNRSSSTTEVTTRLYAHDRFSHFLNLTLGTTTTSASADGEVYEMTVLGGQVHGDGDGDGHNCGSDQIKGRETNDFRDDVRPLSQYRATKDVSPRSEELGSRSESSVLGPRSRSTPLSHRTETSVQNLENIGASCTCPHPGWQWVCTLHAAHSSCLRLKRLKSGHRKIRLASQTMLRGEQEHAPTSSGTLGEGAMGETVAKTLTVDSQGSAAPVPAQKRAEIHLRQHRRRRGRQAVVVWCRVSREWGGGSRSGWNTATDGRAYTYAHELDDVSLLFLWKSAGGGTR
ncbi:hypothetical protein DENSPDRAFT_854753 [Dentipellis sp. KUC8613]|nr:hypothetical protein DENSPDRAFT_854753 [Dentipellis sp. KUC8613]